MSKEAIDIVRSIGCNAIEFMAINSQHLEDLLNQVQNKDLEGFQFISLHTPKAIFQGDKKEIINALDAVQNIHDKFKLNNVVVHPDGVTDWTVFSGFSIPIAIENMDWRKESGKDIESLQKIFSLADVPMVLDVNHCYTNDKTMKLAYEMASEFKSRIVEIHLSGFAGLHEPLFQTKQNEILAAVPSIELPIIIESGCADINEAKREFEYIKNYLKNHKLKRG